MNKNSHLRIIFVLLVLVSAPSWGLKVKGLELGRAVTTQDIANIFGMASCPQPRWNYVPILCTVPISFLGLKTKANVMIDQKSHRVTTLLIEVPSDKLNQIAMIFTKKYGPADKKPGRKVLDNWLNTVTGKTEKVWLKLGDWQWNNVQGCTISINPAAGGFMPNAEVIYTYIGPKKLNPNDM